MSLPPCIHRPVCTINFQANTALQVYGILSLQLLATAFVCVLAMKVTNPEPIGEYHVLSFGSFLAASYGFRMVRIDLPSTDVVSAPEMSSLLVVDPAHTDQIHNFGAVQLIVPTLYS